MSLNALGMEQSRLFPRARGDLQCSREICGSFIMTGLVFPCCTYLVSWRDELCL